MRRGVVASVIRFREARKRAFRSAGHRPCLSLSVAHIEVLVQQSLRAEIDAWTAGAAQAQAEAGPAQREAATRRLFLECLSTVLPITADDFMGQCTFLLST